MTAIKYILSCVALSLSILLTFGTLALEGVQWVRDRRER